MQTPSNEPTSSTDPLSRFSDEPLGERWPLSRFSGRDFARLRVIANATRRPITVLLKDALDLLWQATAADRLAYEERRVAFLRERGVSCDNGYQRTDGVNFIASEAGPDE